MQFSGIFFIMTELCPPDPQWTEQALLSPLPDAYNNGSSRQKDKDIFEAIYLASVYVCMCAHVNMLVCYGMCVCACHCVR